MKTTPVSLYRILQYSLKHVTVSLWNLMKLQYVPHVVYDQGGLIARCMRLHCNLLKLALKSCTANAKYFWAILLHFTFYLLVIQSSKWWVFYCSLFSILLYILFIGSLIIQMVVFVNSNATSGLLCNIKNFFFVFSHKSTSWFPMYTEKHIVMKGLRQPDPKLQLAEYAIIRFY